MKRNSLKVAIVTDSLLKMAGGSRVLECFAQMFPDADIYALFAPREKDREKLLSEDILSHNIYTSKLNNIPFIHKANLYRYTLHKWPTHIERFDFSNYDLVISSSWSVAHGVVTPLDTKHIAYIHTPMRYIWDMYSLYFKNKFPQLVYRTATNFLRIWDTSASTRADITIANSKFVSNRMQKYWKRKADFVVYPPVQRYSGEINTKRGEYYVSGAPFEPNKGGEFLLDCAVALGFELKIIGSGGNEKRLKKKYSKFNNIHFLGWVSEEEKWEIFSKAKGYVMAGTEEFGIFPVEAMSCGTPVLAYASGGVLETVKEGVGGVFFKEETVESFRSAFEKFEKKDWDYVEVSKSISDINDADGFKEGIRKIFVDNGIDI